MKSSFLLLIFNPQFSSTTKGEVAKLPHELKYTMFAFNGFVYDTMVQEKLFNLSDLIND